MADGADIAHRASIPSARWGACGVSNAERRLVYKSLCPSCAGDPVKRELVDLREQVQSDSIPMLTAIARAQRLQRDNDALTRRLRDAKGELKSLSKLRHSHFALPLTESEYLALTSILLDVIDSDPSFAELAICRKMEIQR